MMMVVVDDVDNDDSNYDGDELQFDIKRMKRRGNCE